MIRGLDLSSYQGRPDLKLPPADAMRFAIVKCAEGHSNLQDVDFIANRDSAHAGGLIVGCYNFAHPLPSNDPKVQAGLHFQASGGLGGDAGELAPSLDFEWPDPDKWATQNCTPTQLCDWALAYLDAATSLWGCRPIFYSYPSFIMAIGAGHRADFAAYKLWLADYRSPLAWPKDGDAPTVLAPWPEATLWQTSGGSFYKLPNGARCDTDVFMGTADSLAAWCAGDAL